MLDPGSDWAGRYRLEAFLGAGGMGEVHRAFDLRLNRHVALKLVHVFHQRSTAPAVVAARVLREARAAAALNHPNVVTVYDVGEEKGTPYIVMELIDGTPLRDFIRRDDVPIKKRVAWLRSVAEALAKAHDLGLVHRDIKPDNVFINREGVVKVLDFGIARLAQPIPAEEADGLGRLTITGELVGSPAYMAPEQMMGKDLDGRSDQFSWGVVAYELLTGQRPWPGAQSFAALVARVLSEDPPAPSRHAPSLGPAIDAVILKSLRRDAGDRFGSMREIIAEVDRISAHLLEAPDASAPSPERSAGDEIQATLVQSSGTTTRRLVMEGTYPSDARVSALYRRALGCFRDGNWIAAFAQLSAVVKADPDFAPALLRCALLGRFDGALAADEYRSLFRRAADHRRALPPHDQALLRALEPLLLWDPPDPRETGTRMAAICASFPGDAELHALGGGLNFAIDAALSLELDAIAMSIDPDYADATLSAGISHAQLGNDQEALELFRRTLAISPASADSLWECATIYAVRGDAIEAERNARRSLTIDPSLGAYETLAGALWAQGHSMETVRELQRQKWALLSGRQRISLEAQDRAHLAVLAGDFAEAFLAVEEGERALGDDRDADAHGRLFLIELGVALEVGDEARAIDAAERYLRRKAAWNAPSRETNDATPVALAVLERASRMPAKAACAQRAAWVGQAFFAPSGVMWALGFAPACDLPAALEEARSRYAAKLAFYFHRHPLVRADAGRLFLAMGDHQSAARELAVAARTCLATKDPLRSTLAHLWLGSALEAIGDPAGARAAYASVIERWGSAKPKSKSAAFAAERVGAIGPARGSSSA